RWGIDVPALQLTFDSASPLPAAEISFLLTIAPKHCNYLGNLHGGCAATLFDTLSSMILLGVSKPGFFQRGGVSRHLDVTYLRPVPAGTKVRLVSKVVNIGKRLALLRSEIVRVDNGEVCMVSDHDKANTDAEVKL
ncbi:HotDog domain-containing protein, partial [Aspergillus varians]